MSEAGKDLDEFFTCTAPLPGDPSWQVVVKYRLRDDGSLGQESLTVSSADGALREVDSTVWRLLRLGAIKKVAQATWPLFRATSIGWGDDLPDQLIGSVPGRRGHPLVFYAMWAERYESAWAESPRAPVKALSERHNHNEQTIRAWLAKAERLGFFKRPKSSDGLAGGSLTAKGRRLLDVNVTWQARSSDGIDRQAPGRQLPSPVARYPGGPQKTRSFRRKVDAERHLVEIRHSLLVGTYVDPAKSKATLRRTPATWLRRMRPTWRHGTYEAVETTLRVHVCRRWETADRQYQTHGRRGVGGFTRACSEHSCATRQRVGATVRGGGRGRADPAQPDEPGPVAAADRAARGSPSRSRR